MKSLINGEVVYKREYNFNNPLAVTKILEIHPAPIIIVEGLFILHFTEINERINHKIFIEADENVALERRIQRDGIERGYPEDDVLYKWHNHVMPAYKEYLLPYKDTCDQLIFNNSNEADDIIRISEEMSVEFKSKYCTL